jgi:hypothetical protein
MAVRDSMAALISRVRLLINDPAGSSPQFSDQEIQDVLDASRADVKNQVMIPKATFSGSTIQYLDYYTKLGDWEDDVVLKQYLVTLVTPSAAEPIAGHWQFAETTLPPICISGKTYDLYRAAADLLERLSARWAMSYSMTVDGQSLQRAQVMPALQALANQYRRQQRARTISFTRSDVRSRGQFAGLGPLEIDYMASGDGR